MNHPIRFLLFLLFLLSLILSAAHAQDTAFTYQGELRQSGTPAHGPFDFEVALHVAETGGSPVDVIALDNVVVDRGRFALALDFTEVPFESGPTWLEIRVREGSQTGTYTTLSPRQRVAPVPYAITARGVGENAIDARAIDDAEVQRRVTGSCPPGSTLVGIQADGALDCEPLPISLSVPLDEVGPEHARTSIAVRPDGRAVISYYDSINRDLKLYDCHDPACITGIARTLDSDGDVGQGSSVAIRADGTPIISYADASNNNFKVFACADSGCSQGSTATPRPTLLADGKETAIAIRTDGLPIIAYAGTNDDLAVFACANTSCSGLSPGTNYLVASGNVTDLDIAIGADGSPVISYLDPNVMVFVCAVADCATGSAERIDLAIPSPFGPPRDQTAVAIDVDGLPVIAHGPAAEGSSVFRCTDAFCAGGTRFPLESSGNSASNVDLVIAPSGELMVSYFDAENDTLKLLLCAAEGCTATLNGRNYARISLDGGPASVRTSIAVRPDGGAVIGFIDRLRNRLMVYSCDRATCGQ
mgnify:CR=1 FL=1